jgi:hypothetical protein
MKSLLARLSSRRATGVYIGEHEIAVSQVAATLLGPVELHYQVENYQPDQLASTLTRLLEPLLGQRRSRRRLVAFSLPLLRVLSSTRPLRGVNADVSPKILLHEVLRSPNSNVDEMVIDMMQASPGKRQVVSLVSCRKRYLLGLLRDIEDGGIRPYRVEPSPSALLRAVEQYHPAPRKAKTVLRLLLNEQEGLAVLAVNGWPLVPRSFKVSASNPTIEIISIVRTLDALGKLSGCETSIDAVLIHGGGQLRGTVDLQALESELGAKIKWHDGPVLDNATIAYGSALGCLRPNAQTFDLARLMKPRESIWDLFPWGQFALQLAVMICLGLFLMNHSQELNVAYTAVQSETVGRHWLKSLSEPQLQNEKKELELRVDGMRKFLDTRIIWTAYTHDLPSRLPDNATINSFQGVCEMEKKGRKDDQAMKPKKSILLRINAPIADNGAAPKEIDGFLDALRGHELLKREFPLVELADIKWFQPVMNARPTAFFTVVCLPKPTGRGAAAKTDQPQGQ